MEVKKLKAVRESLLMTQEKMAKNIGISLRYYSDIESGKRKPSKPLEKLIKITLENLEKQAIERINEILKKGDI